VIQWIKTENMSKEDWLQWRNQGIGASEISAITGHNEYQCNLELFYQKIGVPRLDITNLAMLIGLESEDTNAKLWQYWEGDEQSVVRNYQMSNVVRQSEKVGAFAVNDKYPHIFVSLDRKILPHNGKGYGALEFKNTNSFVLRKYENNVVPAHLIQLITQICVCEFEYGEIAYMFENKHFDIFPIPDIKPFMGTWEHIVTQVNDFWDRVVKARPIYNQMASAKMNMNMRLYAELERELSSLEPPAQNSQAYQNFLKERYKQTAQEVIVKGNLELLEVAKTHKAIKEKLKTIETHINECEIKLKQHIGDNKATKIDFGRDGYVSWKKTSDGKIIFSNKVK
jgi:predicted phage-related endonuclease